MKNEEFVDVFIFRQKEQKKHIFQILLFSEFHHKLQLTFAGKEIPTLPQRITDKRTTKRTKFRSDFAKGEERQPAKNPVLSFGPKSGEAEHGEKKRRRVPALPTSEASQPVRNCRRWFFFLLPFSFCRQKEKVRASQKKK